MVLLVRGDVLTVGENEPLFLQVHPEGKFVVDVDKNIDINDVSELVMLWAGEQCYHCILKPLSPLHPGDTQLPSCSKE